MSRRRVLASLASTAVLVTLGGCSGRPAALRVTGAEVALPTSAQAPAPAYATVTNPTSHDDRLLTVRWSLPGSGSRPALINNVTGAGPTDRLVVPAHGRVVLDPYDSDILLLSPGSLRAGFAITLTLEFQHAGHLTVTAPVRTSARIATQRDGSSS